MPQLACGMNPEDGASPEEQLGPNVEATNVWEQVVGDMEATASDLESAGWDTLELHPGDVVIAQNADEPGIDVVLPDNEFADLEALVEGGVQFAEYDVFRAGNTGVEYALLVAKDPERETAVLVPLYYRIKDLLEVIEDREGNLPIYLRVLTEETVLLELTDPDLLVPSPEES